MNSKEQLQQKVKEVVAFTILANEYIHGRTNNLRSVTGEAHPVVMERISV